MEEFKVLRRKNIKKEFPVEKLLEEKDHDALWEKFSVPNMNNNVNIEDFVAHWVAKRFPTTGVQEYLEENGIREMIAKRIHGKINGRYLEAEK